MADILEVVERLPEPIKVLNDSAFEVAYTELRLKNVDSSAMLLAILRLGNSNGSAQWLFSTGITEKLVIDHIKRDFTRRKKSKGDKDAWGKRHQVMQPTVYTASAKKMLEILSRVRHGKTASIYVAITLEAVVLSDSHTVKDIFKSIGLSPSDVKHKLSIGSA